MIPEEMCWKQCKFHAIPSGLVPTFYMRFVIDNHFSYITVYLYCAINSRCECYSKCNECAASREAFFPFFFFVLLLVTLAWQLPKKHVDPLCHRAVNDVVVTLFECCVVN